MKIMTEPISMTELMEQSEVVFGAEMVKAVVDIERNMLAVDAELHADLEEMLLQEGSRQQDLWGINLYDDEEEIIEYDSLINIRPRQNNRSRSVEDPNTRQRVKEVVDAWIK